MAMTPQIQAARRGFNDIILGGVPILLRQNETAFLSFMCSVAAIDALAGYRYATDKVGERFEAFIKEYFPASYASHAENLYKLRCRLLHNFSPAYFTLVHASPAAHLQQSQIGDTILSDDVFFADLRAAALKFFDEVQKDVNRQDAMNAFSIWTKGEPSTMNRRANNAPDWTTRQRRWRVPSPLRASAAVQRER